jgi:predicted RNase H-like nuclease (RuvC/YqgF family)
VSNVGADRTATPPEWDRVELGVRRLLDAHAALRTRVRGAEARVRELEGTVEELRSGALDPLTLNEEVSQLREQNRELERRLEAGRAKVRALLSRLQFLEEDR